MARFLRDEQVSNLTIDGAAITQLIQVFANRGTLMLEYDADADGQQPDVFLYYTIRFDQKGNRVQDTDELLRYFQQATDVERVIFELNSGESIRTNRAVGSYLDLRLDKNENATSYLTVSSDDEDWVNGSFVAVKDVLARYQNRNAWVRNPWVVFLNQIMSLFIGFAVSVWAASKIAPNLTIENAFLISFLMVLLVFSNLWIPVNQRLTGLVLSVFPTIKFDRPKRDKLHWLYQGLVIAIVGAAAIYLLSLIFTYVGKVLGGFVN